MLSSSSSNSPVIPNGEMPKTDATKSDAGSGGSRSVNGAAVHLATPKSNIPSFAAIVSSSSASGRTDSPSSSSTKTPSSTLLRQKHPLPPSSPSGQSSPLGDNRNDSKNSFINNTSFTTVSDISINTSTQSTVAFSSSAASSPSMRSYSEGNTSLDNGTDDAENDQDDSESSDVEIYLDSLDSNNSTERMHVHSRTSATSDKRNQMSSSAYMLPQSSVYLPAQTKTGYPPINEVQASGFRVVDQEKRGPETASVLGAYGNGNAFIDAHSFNLTSGIPVSNDGASFIALHNQAPSQQSTVPQRASSSTSGSPRDRPPLPEVKDTTQATGSSAVDDSACMPNISSSITIDLAKLSINDAHFGGTASLSLGSSLTAANPGASHQTQMGMIGSNSQPCVREGISPTPYDALNGFYTSSASDSALFGLADGFNGAESIGSASENGNTFANGGPGVVKTPNVYINGLAPHFPEDELFNLCSEFGPIKSVRTFTRHVKDSESGYGFVLFENIEDAEKCIGEIRRRYKNLHPTFSKQIHKIPGTNYAAGPSTSWNISVIGEPVNANGFKAKMESLHDPMSTNLYMEGLPLSIDEPTLAALVAPHRIVSSRFFQTRLSNPPRIIAFVRLETRSGAEEVIERLHGRMVRGWNDTGSRIAVRFADTSKQRDLRKERAGQESEASPSRLTIAEASLLNLRGQDLRSTMKPIQPALTGNNLSLPSASSSRGFATSASAPDFSSNGSFVPHGQPSYNLPIGHGFGRTVPGTLERDYPLALGGNSGLHSRSRSPYAGGFSLRRENYPESHNSVPHFGSMQGHEDALLNDDVENIYSQVGGREHHRRQAYGLPFGPHHLPISQSIDSMLGPTHIRPSPVYTCSGYTPAEEYIMRAHAEGTALAQVQHHQSNVVSYQPRHMERIPLPLGRSTATDAETAANIGVGMRAYRVQASLMSPTVTTSTSANSISSFSGDLKMGDGEFGLSSNTAIMTEEDFLDDQIPSTSMATLRSLHASRLSRELRSYQASQRPAVHSSFLPVSPSTMNLDQDHSPSPSLPTEASVSPNPNDTMISAYQSATTHMRSTTVPQHRSSAVANGQIRGHHQHSSMSIPKQNLSTPQHASVARFGSGPTLVEESSGMMYECDAQGVGNKIPADAGVRSSSSNNGTHRGVGTSVPLKTHYSSSAIFGDAEHSSPLSASSSLISPTLTYGSQTPSTLSPPTPFFGSFNAEGFDKNGTGEQKIRTE